MSNSTTRMRKQLVDQPLQLVPLRLPLPDLRPHAHTMFQHTQRRFAQPQHRSFSHQHSRLNNSQLQSHSRFSLLALAPVAPPHLPPFPPLAVSSATHCVSSFESRCSLLLAALSAAHLSLAQRNSIDYSTPPSFRTIQAQLRTRSLDQRWLLSSK